MVISRRPASLQDAFLNVELYKTIIEQAEEANSNSIGLFKSIISYSLYSLFRRITTLIRPLPLGLLYILLIFTLCFCPSTGSIERLLTSSILVFPVPGLTL